VNPRRYFWIFEFDGSGEARSVFLTTPPGAPSIPSRGDISIDALSLGRGGGAVLDGVPFDVVGSGWFLGGSPGATRHVVEITKTEYDAADAHFDQALRCRVHGVRRRTTVE
jgi:hypothetical protein